MFDEADSTIGRGELVLAFKSGEVGNESHGWN